MTGFRHATEFAGYPVVEWKKDQPGLPGLSNPVTTAVALRIPWSENATSSAWLDLFTDFVNRPEAQLVPALIVGSWGWFEWDETIASVVEAIAANRDQLPALEAVFLGDIVQEENEISWIHQDDLSPLLNAYPNLKHLHIRGSDGLVFGTIDMPKLESLRIESGGLDRSVVRSIGEGSFPALTSLVLWLGTSNYGANTTIDDLQPFHECERMPNLKYLGLCDSEIADEVAEFIATAPVLQRLDVLDLSLGTLTDDGALALLMSPYLSSLKKLDLHHHYCSPGMVEKLRSLSADGLEVDVSNARPTDGEWRFVAVSE